MQTITKLAGDLAGQFKTSKRTDGNEYVYLPDDAPDHEAIKSALYKAHGDGERLPDDWIYATFQDLLERISGYTIETPNDLDEYRHEIVDSAVDIYTHDLTAWLHSDNRNVYYLTAVQDEYGPVEDGSKLLAMAQYMAIDEIMSAVCDLLAERHEL